MIKKIFFIALFFISFNSFSQNIDQIRSVANFSSESELVSYVEKAKLKGLNLIQVEKLAVAQGAKPSEIQLLRKLWNSNNNESSIDSNLKETTIESSFGIVENENEDEDEDEDEDEFKRFGSDFFNNKNISEAPQLFIATPSDYRLGPGDELMINLYGASENTYSVEISRNGTLKIDRAAPIYLSGLSINSAKKRLIKSLSKLYTGLLSSDELNKVELDLSLSKARSVVVNITGQVTAPGTYTISGFSSALNALYAAGGPNEVGSYRNIKLLRNGKVYKTIDLYDYFVGGVYPNLYLRDQDVILVESYSNLVNIDNGFKINGLFEIKEDEKLSDLIKFSGGFSSNSYKDKVFINRIDSYSRSIVEYSLENYDKANLKDGDLISAKTVVDFVENSVSVDGAVYLPGIFDISKAMSVKQLIESSKGLTPDALSKALLYRTNNGVQDEIVSLNLDNKSDLSIQLFENDALYIPSANDISLDQVIEIKGEVNNPKEVDFKDGLTISDLIIMSGGLTTYANPKDLRIFRNISTQGDKKITREINLELDDNLIPNKNILLLPDDIVTVNASPFRRNNQFYSIKGEVALPGLYSIKNQNYSVYDAINDNIQFLESATTDGISILRDSIQIPVYGQKLLSQGSSSKFNFELVSGDVINIPAKNKTALVSGAVQQDGIINIDRPISAKKVIDNVGGFTEKSLRKGVYVEYQNGLRKVTRNFLFFKFYPKVYPGSKVVVPEKDENTNKTSVGEIVGYTTSLVSIIALIKSL
ncbi:SLBB domain-containing protein [Flavobacteriaceae bacterium]|nr:SLBB domain-containing protein [Flavobacteriaceae bacterium]